MTAVASSRDVAASSLFNSCCEQQRRRGAILSYCCCGSRDVEAQQTAVAAAETLRRHSGRLLLRQQRRCGVTLADCCCGSRDVAASHSQTAVAAAETLRRHSGDCCCGSRDVAASHSHTAVAAAETLRRRILADCCCGSRGVEASHSQTACGVTLADRVAPAPAGYAVPASVVEYMCVSAYRAGREYRDCVSCCAWHLQLGVPASVQYIASVLTVLTASAPSMCATTASVAEFVATVSVEFVALASAVIAAPAVVVPVPDAFVVPAPAWCAAPAPATGYISQGAARVQSEECILRRAFGEEVVLSLWLLSQSLPPLYRPSTVEVQRWYPRLHLD